MLSEGPSGLWWGCRTTQVESSDAQPEQGGLASISPIHSPCVHTHTHTLKHTPTLECQQTRCHTHAQFASTFRAATHTHSNVCNHTHFLHVDNRELSQSERHPEALHRISQKGTLCVHLWSVEPQGFWVCVFVCACGWGGYFEPSHPLNPRSPTLIERQDRGSELEAGLMCFSHELRPHLPLTFSH